MKPRYASTALPKSFVFQSGVALIHTWLPWTVRAILFMLVQLTHKYTDPHMQTLCSWTSAKPWAKYELLKRLSIHQERSSFSSRGGSKHNLRDYTHGWECLIWFVHAILKTLRLTCSQAYAMSTLRCCVKALVEILIAWGFFFYILIQMNSACSV